MAVTTSLTSVNLGDDTYKFTMFVAYDPGGGPPGSVDVHVTIDWEYGQLDSPTAISPAAGPVPFTSTAGGLVLWQDATVDETGTDFTVTLACAGGFTGTTVVTGIAEEVVSKRVITLKTGVICE